MTLDTPVNSLGFVYKAKKKPLEKIGILTLKDLLYYPPVRYENYPDPAPINTLTADRQTVVEGEVITMENKYTRRKITIQKALIKDESGEIECTWFNQPYLTRVIHEGDLLRIVGKVKYSGNKKSISVKDYDVVNNEKKSIHIGKIVPVYSETRGLSSKWIRNRIYERLNDDLAFTEIIPQNYLDSHGLFSIESALRTIHFPENYEDLKKASLRLSYEEILIKHLASLKIKADWDKQQIAQKFEIKKFDKKISALIKSLPFELTNSQKNAIDAIFSDVQKERAMNRLLEGDVGSGKTIVAAIASYVAFLNGFQASIMAPTGILAQQHYNTLNNLLSPLGVRVELFTSGSNSKKTKDQRPTTNGHSYDIAVGTHALIHNKVAFDNLGLIIIDEQQRFGVEQRAILREKGTTPHVLTMTATPIPRTILLTAYGDLDISLLDEMPKGRKIIKTWLVPDSKRESGYQWIKEKIKNGDQVFIVCPFIESSETMTTVKAATEEFEKLKNDIFKEYRLGLLHGKMKPDVKNNVLDEFKEKKFNILVTTPVVEVGIDIPNATVMVIEGAERFGLSQLHQMRGRVGRGEKESYCLLFSDNLSPISEKRLKSLEKIFSGPELSEIDLQLRGPGNIYGTAQHGRTDFRFASIFDKSLISLVKNDAVKLIKELDRHKLLRDEVESTIIQKVSPD